MLDCSLWWERPQTKEDTLGHYSQKVAITSKTVIDPETGKSLRLQSTQTEYGEYYNVKRLNWRAHMKDIFDIVEKVCNSSKQVAMFHAIIDGVGTDNRFRKNVTTYAQAKGFDRSAMSKMLAGITKHGMALKEERGVYFMNPYVMSGKWSKSSALEALQTEWDTLRKAT